MRSCRKCGEEKPLEKFRKAKDCRLGRAWTCYSCETKRINKWRNGTEGGKRLKRNQSLSKFGLTTEQFSDILNAQGGLCAICRGSVTYAGKSMVVDHDHSCCPGAKTCGKCIRGILCGHCNFMLGHAKDSPEILLSAIKYLSHNSAANG